MPKACPTKRVESGRVTKTCPICGRGIFMDHNLSDLNYDAHVAACPERQARARLREGRSYIRRLAKAGKGLDQGLPKLGQLGFPFDGVPQEVGG